MTKRKTGADISKSTAAQQPQEGEAPGDNMKSQRSNETTKPGENAAANASEPRILQKGVADGS